MIPDLYLHKSPGDDDEASDTIFSALDTPRSLENRFDDYLNVAYRQEDYNVKSRALPENRGAKWLLFPDDSGKQLWDVVVLV
jgi:hypothetical protein